MQFVLMLHELIWTWLLLKMASTTIAVESQFSYIIEHWPINMVAGLTNRHSKGLQCNDFSSCFVLVTETPLCQNLATLKICDLLAYDDITAKMIYLMDMLEDI